MRRDADGRLGDTLDARAGARDVHEDGAGHDAADDGAPAAA